jgi:hypothetical protein
MAHVGPTIKVAVWIIAAILTIMACESQAIRELKATSHTVDPWVNGKR